MDIQFLFQLVAATSGPIIPFLIYLMVQQRKSLKWIGYSRLEYKWPRSVREDIKNANEIWFYGIHLKETVQNYYPLLKQIAADGKRIQFLLADPEGVVFEMVEKRFFGDHGKDERGIAINTIQTLELLQKKYSENVQIKVIDYLFPKTVYIINPKEENGIIYVSHHTYRLNDQKSKAVYRKKNSDHYELIIAEYKNIWKSIKK